MQSAFLAAVSFLLLSTASASAAQKEELVQKSNEFMNSYYRDVIQEFKDLKAQGRSYNATDLETMVAVVSAKHFTQRVADSASLMALLDQLHKSGEAKDFKIYEQGSPELKKELEQATKDLLDKNAVSGRIIGAAILGGTQILTDVARMTLTRYTEPR